MPATKEEREFVLSVNPIIKKFPTMTQTVKGEEPRDASWCVVDFFECMNRITVYTNYIDQRNKQRDMILQVLGINDVHKISGIYVFFENKLTFYKDAIKQNHTQINQLQLILNSLYDMVMRPGTSNLTMSERDLLPKVGDKLLAIATRLRSSEDQLIEEGIIGKIELPGAIRFEDELINFLVKFYLEIYAAYPDTNFLDPRGTSPNWLISQGHNLERNLRGSADNVKMAYNSLFHGSGVRLSTIEIVAKGENLNAPGDFGKAVLYGLLRLRPAPAAGGRRKTRHNKKRSKKTRGHRRH